MLVHAEGTPESDNPPFRLVLATDLFCQLRGPHALNVQHDLRTPRVSRKVDMEDPHYKVADLFRVKMRRFSLANDDTSNAVHPRTRQRFRTPRTSFLRDDHLHGSPPCTSTHSETLQHSNRLVRTSAVPGTAESHMPHDGVSARV